MKFLLNQIKVFLHGCMLGCHFHNFKVVLNRWDRIQRFIHSLNELRRKPCLHVFKFILQLVDTGFGGVGHPTNSVEPIFSKINIFCYFGLLLSQFWQRWNNLVQVLTKQFSHFFNNFAFYWVVHKRYLPSNDFNLLINVHRASNAMDGFCYNHLLHLTCRLFHHFKPMSYFLHWL